MELNSKSLLGVEGEQKEGSTSLVKSMNINPSIDCQNDMEGTVIYYDSDAHGETIVNVVTNSESKNVLSLKDSDDPDNMITLHASTDDTKNDVNEEAIINKNMDIPKSDIQININNQKEKESDDDETIATFITSTGQQLALYAVEDSDEIFAVALYDESGEPPSNFHFLLKADVERLIGEGAVKTVKKPTLQQKKEAKPQDKKEIIYETYEENRRKSEKAEELKKKQETIKMNVVEVPKADSVQKKRFQTIAPKTTTNIIKTENNNKNFSINKKQLIFTKPNKTISNTSSTPTRFDKKKESSTSYIISNDNESYIYDHLLQDDLDSDVEIIEQSTVQYLLCDGDYSDSDLTFDELQASLKNFKTNKPTLNKSKNSELKNNEKKKTTIKYIIKSSQNNPIISQKKDPITTIYRTYKNPKKPRLVNNIQTSKQLKREMEDPSLSDFSTFEDGPNSSDELPQNEIQNSMIIENLPNIVKVKRSRKQQLTVVNRTDSEIIIQPASVFSEEEEEPVVTRKRGRRKKKLLPDPDYNPRKSSRRTRRSHRSVEIIEIDVDENDRSNILEITLDGKKGKGSSDKENDIISVGDSDDSEEDSDKRSKSPLMQCSHCMRNFRKRRALERHLDICQKSPPGAQKMENRKTRMIGKGKKFKCKSCNEYFDIAVALARHVRAVHSPRKRGRPPKNSWLRNEDSDSSDMEDSMDESTPEPEREPKRRGRPRVKRSLSKDESPVPEIELKLDSSVETSVEPRRRGRPPKKKLSKERSASPADSVDKNSHSREPTVERMVQALMEPTPEPRKRGRPSKKSMSKEGRSITPDLKEKSDNTSEHSAQIPKKRGRPSKRTLSKDERSTTPEIEDKNENSVDLISEPRRRGRPSKTSGSVSKNRRSESPEVEVKFEVLADTAANDKESLIADLEGRDDDDNIEILSEISKNFKLSKDTPVVEKRSVTPEPERNDENSVEVLSEAQKKSMKTYKEKSLKDDQPEVAEVELKDENPTESLVESRKKSKSNKDKTSQDESSVIPEVEEKESESAQVEILEENDSAKMKKKIVSPNRTWKVKKLNCADCGKWFSSAAALTTHRLQHRTKTSGHLVHHCPICKKFITLELFAKHLSVVHGKPVSKKTRNTTSLVRRVLTRVAKPARNWNVRTLRSSN